MALRSIVTNPRAVRLSISDPEPRASAGELQPGRGLKMKTDRFVLIAVMALGSLLAFTPSTVAKSPKGEGRNPRLQGRMQKIAEQLSLTDEQKEKLKSVFREEAKKMRELRADKTLSRREKNRTKAKELRETLDTKLKPGLTAEQLEKWEMMQGKTQGRHKKQ